MSESILGGCLTKAAYLSEYRKQLQPLVLKVRYADSHWQFVSYRYVVFYYMQPREEGVAKASFWGQTCAPDFLGYFGTTNLEEGDWILFENMGSYTASMVA